MSTPTTTTTIATLRAEIEQLDQSLIDLIARRQELARAIACAKQEAGLPVVDLAREAAVVRGAAAHARDAQLDEEALRHIFWCLIDLSRRAQLDAQS